MTESYSKIKRTIYMAPGYSMRSLRDMAIPYQRAPEVSIVRTDTCLTLARLGRAMLCAPARRH